MGEPHVISPLVRKRAELAGEIEATEKRVAQLCADLIHVDAALRIFDPEYRVSDIRPKRPVQRDELFAFGELARMTLDTLRTAPEPLTTRQIARRIIAAKGLDARDTRLLDGIDKRVSGDLRPERRRAGRAREPREPWPQVVESGGWRG